MLLTTLGKRTNDRIHGITNNYIYIQVHVYTCTYNVADFILFYAQFF